VPYFEVQLTKKLQRVYDVAADTLIGRAPQCQIQLLSRAVSRRHARIEFDGEQAIISDLGTANGIKLNGHQVQGAAVVSDGDTLVVGDINMVYRAADRSLGNVVDLRGRAPTPRDAELAAQPQATFRLSADADALGRFQATVGRARIARLEFDEISQFKLQIALREAIENARIHGCHSDASRSVYVTFREDPDEFVMSVKDEGSGYDVDATLGGASEVDALQAVRERHKFQGSVGLRIILNCVDRIQFAERGATVHMGKVKEAGQLLVISDDALGDASAEEPFLPGGPATGGPAPGGPGGGSPFPLSDGSSEEGPLRLGDLY
jgi:anti-sigma regulatory factor (Ser/Thr protein kinase)